MRFLVGQCISADFVRTLARSGHDVTKWARRDQVGDSRLAELTDKCRLRQSVLYPALDDKKDFVVANH